MVASAVASPLRLGWLRIQIVGALFGVALLLGACGAGPSPTPSSSDSSTAGFTPINQMTLRVRLSSMAWTTIWSAVAKTSPPMTS